ncbi:MAG: hypothetical protein ACTTJI_05345 [Capnocytophaga sp.]|jgi:hypothetical protein|uniref:hypothetical protein n=1 Tax=Capnocytophaga sp. TaxID=44737 RepID=UPI0028E3AE17|nr:hypothetical protein [uncultured Capnocytophaga sp.]
MEPHNKITSFTQQDNLLLCDERIELLNTIKELVKREVKKRIEELNAQPHHSKTPPSTFIKTD